MIVSQNFVHPVVVSGSGTIAVAAAPASGFRNCLVGCSITLASNSTLEWRSASTGLTGAMVLSALDWDALPCSIGQQPAVRTRLDCASAEALNLVVGATATGVAYYVIEKV